jgi:hypothetical protein
LALVPPVTDEVPRMSGRNSGMSSLITNDVKNITDHDLIICHCLIHHENMCAKSLKMTNVVTVVSKFVNFIMSKGINHHQFKDFWSDMESEYRDVLLLYKNSLAELWFDA